jgi:hypothetical protein
MAYCYGAGAKVAEKLLFLYYLRLNFQPTAPFQTVVAAYICHLIMAYI